MTELTPTQIDRALAAWDRYVNECDSRRRAQSMMRYGHPGAHIPDTNPDRREAMRLALEAGLDGS